MNKDARKQNWAREMESQGKRVYGRRPLRRNRKIIFTPYEMIMKEKRRKRKLGISVNT